MELWQKLLNSAFRQPVQLALFFPGIDVRALDEVAETYPMCINPYYLSLVERPDDPIGRQCIPDPAELDPTSLLPDPLAEESMSPVPCVVHRYPDRALFLVTTRCAMYCRFCTRKRKVGKDKPISDDMRRAGLDYWEHIDVHHHESLEAALVASGHGPVLCFSARADRPYTEAPYSEGARLVFGPETRGLPQDVLDANRDCTFRIPIWGKVRSLNLSNAAAVAAYEAIRQWGCRGSDGELGYDPP